MLNIFSQLKIRNLLDRDPDKCEPHPRKAWAIIFSAMIILIVLVLIANLSFYAYMRTDTSFKSGDSSPAAGEAKLNRKGLAEITALFEGKKAEFQNLLASPPHITDPSLADSSLKKVNLKNASSTPTFAQ